MKKILAMTLLAALLLTGFGNAAPQETTAPTVVTTEPTTEPTVPTTEAPVYYDPLNGEIIDAPFDGRIYASTISNIPSALPHVNVVKADILMEMYVNNHTIRCLALFSDIGDIEAIGSTRSTRLMFNDIAEHYNAILTHAGGSSQCIKDANARGITHYNVDSLMRQWGDLLKGTAYRDKEYKYGEHNLFVIGPGVKAYAESEGVQLTGMPETDYGLTFVEDGRPSNGTTAKRVIITLVTGGAEKETAMHYNEELGKYVYYQYDKRMEDQFTGEVEAFENVVVMFSEMRMNKIYQETDFLTGGEGYYANGGRMIPIKWTCESETSPFRFFKENGEPLSFGQGNTYIAVCDPDSRVYADNITIE